MRSGTELYLRLVIAGMMTAGCLQACGCHTTAMVFGPSALPAGLAPNTTDDAKAAAAKKQLPGIPFYNHYGVCAQEMVWLEPQTTLSFTVTPDGGNPVTRTMTLNNWAFHDPEPSGHDAYSLVTSLTEVEGEHENADPRKLCPASVAKDWDAVREAYKVVPINDSDPDEIAKDEDKNHQILVRVSNTADIGTAVDYSRVYYLNARSPLIGTGSVDAKLNLDGTLGEGNVSVDDETLGDVLTAASTVGSAGLTAWSTVAAARITGNATIQGGVTSENPAAEILNQPANGQRLNQPACAASDGWPEVKSKVAYAFTITPGGFKHDHKKVTPLEDNGGKCEASSVVLEGSYTVTPVSADSKPDPNSIGVSGTITLPKTKASATPPKP